MKTFIFQNELSAKGQRLGLVKNSDRRIQIKGAKIYFITLLILILSISIFPKEIKADIIGVLNYNPPMIVTYNEITWEILNSDSLKMSGWYLEGAQTVTLNRVSNKYYVILIIHSGPRLATVDPNTGLCADIGPLGGYISSITFSSDGILYGMGWSNVYAKNLYRIDTATGIPTFVAVPFNLGEFYHVIAYNPDDNYIYHWAGGAPNANMGRINLSTFIETPCYTIGDSSL